MNKKLMIVFDVALWVAVIIPIIKLLLLCINAYYEGVSPSFNDGPVYYGMKGFRMMFWIMMFYGFFYVILWTIIFIAAVIFTIYMIRRIKKTR